MNAIHTFLLTSIGTALLTACGGGGETPVPLGLGQGPGRTLVITPANAKAVAANALSQATHRLNTLGGAGPMVANTEFLSPSTSSLAKPTVLNSNSLKTGQVCGAGGSVQVTGSIANASGLSTGDAIQSTYQNCGILADGWSPAYLDGSATQTVTSGSAITMPFQIVLTGTLNNMRMGIPQSGGGFSEIHVLNGNQKLEWSASSRTAQTLSISGNSLTNKSTVGAVVRTHNWAAYHQTIRINGVYTGYSLDAFVNSDNTHLGPSGGSYILQTLAPIVKDTVSNILTAGVIRVEGYFNARALIGFGTNHVVQVDVDANGDGVYEATVFSTVSELSTLL
jgi:hypothetical protein